MQYPKQQNPNQSEHEHLYGDAVPYLKKDLEFRDLASRIRYVAENGFDGNLSELARALGTGSGTIGNWLTRNQGMDPSYAFILQDQYRWNARWILEGVLPRRMEVSDEQAERLYQQILSLPPERRRALLLLLGDDD
jgi:hypothetical protein